jgi:hypothetical protein
MPITFPPLGVGDPFWSLNSPDSADSGELIKARLLKSTLDLGSYMYHHEESPLAVLLWGLNSLIGLEGGET